MIKILSVFGTRPEAIKMAPVIREILLRSTKIISIVCNTSQHQQMLDQVMQLFQITPAYDLNIMQRGQSLADVTIAVLEKLKPVLQVERPDWLLVQGDTTTAMAAALTAYYERIKIGHVEAGLRTYNKYQPFPEDINRRVIDMLADLHFAPTNWAANNLRTEGVPEEKIVLTGNTVIDAIEQMSTLSFSPQDTLLAKLPFNKKRIILVTMHRRESFGRGIEEACAGLRAIAENHSDVHLVYPVHLNPNVQEPVYRILNSICNITLLPPLDYLSFIWLLKQSYLVITDSGGLQEEAPGLGKPVLVLREITERPEGIEAGSVKLVGTNAERIFYEIDLLLTNPDAYHNMAQSAKNLYGDGSASCRIVDRIMAQATY